MKNGILAYATMAALAVGVSSCDSSSSPTAPAPSGGNPTSTATSLVASWFSVSDTNNETVVLNADSTARYTVDQLDEGVVYHMVILGTWSASSTNLTLHLKSATRGEVGATAQPFTDFPPELKGTYMLKGDSLVVVDDAKERTVYHKGTAPTLTKPSIKTKVVGTWKGGDPGLEYTLEILSGGTYTQTTKYLTTGGTTKWSKVEGKWTVAGSTLVMEQVKMSESSNGSSWTAVADFFPLTEEWPATFSDANHMSLKADEGSFDYQRL